MTVCPEPVSFHHKIGDVLLLSLLFLLGFLARFVFVPLMPLLEGELHMGHAQAGSLFLWMAVGFVSGQIFSGFLSSRIHHRGTLILSGLLVGGVLVFTPWAHSPALLKLLLAALGLAAGMHLPSAVATLAASVSRQDWGKAMGLHQTAPSLGMVLGPLLVEGALGWMSWRALVVTLGALSAGAGILYAWKGGSGAFPGRRPDLASLGDVLRLPGFWIMAVLFGAGIGAAVGVYSMLPLFLVHEKGWAPGPANILLGLSRLPGLVLTFLGGWLADRLGIRITMGSALILSGLTLVGMIPAQGRLLVLLVFLQPALITLFFAPAFAALSQAVPPARRSIATSFGPPLAFVIGGGLFPFLIGRFGDLGAFSTGLLGAGAYVAAVSALLPLLKFHPSADAEGC